MDVITLLANLVNINSANPFCTVPYKGMEIGIGNEGVITDFLEKQLRDCGFKVSRQIVQEETTVTTEGKEVYIPPRYNLLAEKGSGSRSLLFLAHTDTVDVKEGWETDPFSGVVKKVAGRERMYGLGVNDMKAGIAIILAALKEVVPEGYRLKVAFVADEEFWSFGTVKLLETDFLSDVELAIVPELGDFDRKTQQQSIVLGRMGRSEYVFEVQGIACHGAQARVNQYAVNAVHESVKLQQMILNYCKESERRFTGGDVSIVNASYISHHSGGKPILSVPERASFILDRSFVMGEHMERELKILRKIVADAYETGVIDKRAVVTVNERSRPTKPCKPYFISPDSKDVQFVTAKVDAIRKGHEYGIGYSVADENRLAERGIPTIVLGPLGERSHSSQEWVDLESVQRLVEVYKSIANDFGGFRE